MYHKSTPTRTADGWREEAARIRATFQNVKSDAEREAERRAQLEQAR
jgi:hypothetical protein